MYYAIRPKRWMKMLFPQEMIWGRPVKNKKTVYLSFDDGPHPEITPHVLDILDHYKVRANFFLIGNNVVKYPEICKLIQERNHVIGNHSFHHLNGWKVRGKRYLKDIATAAKYINSDLFRPPYGRLKPHIARILLKQYRIVMWSLLSGDFDTELSGEDCLNNIKNYVKDGDIIVFHDSEKAKDRLYYALPLAIEWLLEKGYDIETIK